jgi:TadE-like protein
MLHQAAAQFWRFRGVARRWGSWRTSHRSLGCPAPRVSAAKPFHHSLRSTALPAQSLVEFSIIAALALMPLLLGVIDLARVFYYDVSLNAAAMNGVGLASAGVADTTVGDSIKGMVEQGAVITLTDSNIDIQPPCASRTTFTWATVTITYSFSAITPYVRGLLVAAGGTDPYTIRRRASQVARVDCT